MTHRRVLLVVLAVAALFAAGYSLLAPQDLRGWGSIEIVDISIREGDGQGIEIAATLRFPGARFGAVYRFAVRVMSEQCGIDVQATSDERVDYWQGDLVERIRLSPVCAADDYQMIVVLVSLRLQELARDTMRFSVPSSP